MLRDVVTAVGLTKRYRGSERPAVDDVSFEIAQGETIGLLGPNGAGKTTLIKMICGVTTPTSGEIRVFEADPVRQPVLAKSGIGAMHQTGPFDMMLPALDNLRIAARFRGLRWREVRPWAFEVADFLGLSGAMQRLVFQMSGGQRQRLQLVRALLTIPRLLILDEPSAGLDVAGRRQVERFVTWLREEHGVTVLWTSHHIDELERNSQRVLVVDRGRVVRFAKPRELVEEFGSTHLLVTVEDPESGGLVAAWAESAGLRAKAEDNEVRIDDAKARDLLPELSRYCQDHAIAINGVSTAVDSLEEVFLRMTGNEG
ncbi:ABC transporter ATP-binding protein [Microbispora sp. H10670]|uniref:ABC transporter ATP-binding protein n=1 Tax=unclassified Microbispora TaxID=2614687 RepID=UPI001C722328|nr:MULTISPECIES: ABC transporter ATP-binding protein [unclassified Microbispora]